MAEKEEQLYVYAFEALPRVKADGQYGLSVIITSIYLFLVALGPRC